MDTSLIDHHWWKNLQPQWKQAFAETFFRQVGEPSHDMLQTLYQATALRFAGPSAPYPNMSIELTDLSGVSALANLEILVVTHHRIQSIQELSSIPGINNLFLYNNEVTSLDGIEDHIQLEKLYVQWNRIGCIKPVQKLLRLKELYIHNNSLSSLEGLVEQHADNLEMFFCKPNDSLKQKEILRVERELGIRCRSI